MNYGILTILEVVIEVLKEGVAAITFRAARMEQTASTLDFSLFINNRGLVRLALPCL